MNSNVISIKPEVQITKADETIRVGLMVARLQPMHNGHCWVIDEMIKNCQVAIIGLGSAQKSGEEHDPWTVEQRIAMIRNVYGDRVKIVPYNDLGTTSTTTVWCDYILEKLQKLGLKSPTDYYTGSRADGIWYKERFFLDGFSPAVDKNPICNFFVDGVQRKLHIMDRDTNPIPSATELRTFMKLGDDGWRKWIPRVNWSFIEATYPENLKVK